MPKIDPIVSKDQAEGSSWEAFKAAVLVGEVTMLITTVIYACQSVLAKLVEVNIPSMELVFVRSFIAGSVTLRTSVGMVTSKRQDNFEPNKLPPPWIDELFGPPDVRPLCAARGILGATAFALFYAAFPYLTISEHTTIQFMSPVFIIFFAWPVLGEVPTLVDCGSISLAVAGSLLVMRPAFLFSNGTKDEQPSPDEVTGQFEQVSPADRLRGIALCGAGSIMSAMTMVIVRKIGNRVPSLVLATWFHASSCILGGLFLTTKVQPVVVPSPWEVVLLLMISFTSFTGQLALNYSYQTLPAARAATLSYLQLVWGFTLDATVLKEAVRWTSIVGALFVASGGVMGKLLKPVPVPISMLPPEDGHPRTKEESSVEYPDEERDGESNCVFEDDEETSERAGLIRVSKT